jgi:phage-related protein
MEEGANRPPPGSLTDHASSGMLRYVAEGNGRRNLIWMGSSRDDLRQFPEEVKDMMGYALHLAQSGEKHADSKPLRGFGGAGVLEVVEDDQSGTYRAVYTVNLETAVYVLHAFQKKSKGGVATPPRDLDIIRSRLADASAIDKERAQRKGGKQ